jgi:hypothetical protein
MVVCLILALTLMAMAAGAANAQTVHGTVVNGMNSPYSAGAVTITVKCSDGTVLGSGVNGSGGSFSVPYSCANCSSGTAYAYFTVSGGTQFQCSVSFTCSAGHNCSTVKVTKMQLLSCSYGVDEAIRSSCAEAKCAEPECVPCRRGLFRCRCR